MQYMKEKERNACSKSICISVWSLNLLANVQWYVCTFCLQLMVHGMRVYVCLCFCNTLYNNNSNDKVVLHTNDMHTCLYVQYNCIILYYTIASSPPFAKRRD